MNDNEFTELLKQALFIDWVYGGFKLYKSYNPGKPEAEYIITEPDKELNSKHYTLVWER